MVKWFGGSEMNSGRGGIVVAIGTDVYAGGDGGRVCERLMMSSFNIFL